MAAQRLMTSLPQAKRFDWTNLGVRVVSALVLIPAVVAAIWFGGWAFLVMLAIAGALLANEWGKMSAPVAPLRVSAVVTAAVLVVIFTAFRGHYYLAWGLVAVGAAVAALVARGVAERPADAAYGVIYIAPAGLALVWLREMPQGVSWSVLLYAVTWSADIMAFVVGSTLKGPKLWPRYSPNKTWTGFFGGLAGAMAAAVIVAVFAQSFDAAFGLDGKLARPGVPLLVWYAAALIGLLGGLATMAGDLWESMLKRRFGVKDSGDLIPGHGGLLDRVDGLMFAVMVVAGARLIDYWGWGH